MKDKTEGQMKWQIDGRHDNSIRMTRSDTGKGKRQSMNETDMTN